MPRKKKSADAFNKSAFIRDHADKSAGEIEKLASEKGHQVSAKLVYVVRASDKARARGGKKAKAGARVSAGRKGGARHSGTAFSADEKALLQLVKRVGVDRAGDLVGLASAFFSL